MGHRCGIVSVTFHSYVGLGYGITGNLTIAHQMFFNVDIQNGSLPEAINLGFFLMLGIYLLQKMRFFVTILLN